MSRSRLNIPACNDKERANRYTGRNRKFDGIHLYGQSGKEAFTKSLITILTNAVAAPVMANTKQKKVNDHDDCPQTRFQHQKYSVPVNNMFEVLGN